MVGGTWSTGNAPTASWEIKLDDVIPGTGKGLADTPLPYEFRVKARDTTGSYSDSTFSEIVRIVDNPILVKGKASGNSPSGDGFAALEWKKEPFVDEYTLRYRELGDSYDHADLDWPNHPDWPHYSEFHTDHPAILQPDPWSSVSTTVGGLDHGKLYAFQVNYVNGLDGTEVFSARDAYVWPSTGFPGSADRVATYTFFGHHPNREFEYIICEDGFADDPTTSENERTEWVELIKDAFRRWQTSTDGLVTVVHDAAGSCADNATPMDDYIMSDDAQNEVRMLAVTGDASTTNIWSFRELSSDPFKMCLYPERTIACVSSFTGYSGLETECDATTNTCETSYAGITVGPIGNPFMGWIPIHISFAQSIDRAEIVELLRGYLQGTLSDEDEETVQEIIVTAATNKRQASNPIQSVDVTFKASGFPDGPQIPDRTPFNTCRPDLTQQTVDDPDLEYSAYRIALHEAGHALGLSNVDYPYLDSVAYHDAHPTIPDAVLNYDSWEDIRHPSVGAGFFEPDCSPHPFDVMAIYALYQTRVPAVSIVKPGPVLTFAYLEALAYGGSPPYDYEWSSPSRDLDFSDTTKDWVFVTPPNIDSTTEYTVQVVVTDENGAEARDEFVITWDPP